MNTQIIQTIANIILTCIFIGAMINPSPFKGFIKNPTRVKLFFILFGISMIFNIVYYNIIGSQPQPIYSTQSSEHNLLTKENYNKIKLGMDKKTVDDILGTPSMISETEIDEDEKTEMCFYQHGFETTGIDIYFQNGKVVMKNWVEL